ncbi:MAG: hypothetical protein MO853_06940 [Candidatus Protistobacter heckmanni]|nr:hypothetical protein [Candidatus Protistobacter heckmanni]
MAAPAGSAGGASPRAAGGEPASYYDAHNHLSGILHWPTYANLPAYLAMLQGQGAGPSDADKRRLLTWLRDWELANRERLGDRPYSTRQRFAMGPRRRCGC